MNSTSMWLLPQLRVFKLLKLCSWEFSSSGTLPPIPGCLFPSVLRLLSELPLLQGSVVQWRMLGQMDLWNRLGDYDWWLAGRKSNNRPITDSRTAKVVLKGMVLKWVGGGMERLKRNKRKEKVQETPSIGMQYLKRMEFSTVIVDLQ